MDNGNIKLNRILKIYLFSITVSLTILIFMISKTILSSISLMNVSMKYSIIFEAFFVCILLILYIYILYLYMKKKKKFKQTALLTFKLFSLFLLFDTMNYVFFYESITNTTILFIIYIYIPLIVLTYNMDVIVRHLFK